MEDKMDRTDEVVIGSGMFQALIGKIIRGLISKRIRRQSAAKILFNSPIILENDGKDIICKVNVSACIPVEDFKSLMEGLL